ncbi:1-deoxy-D-xylulose 5-phosphate reductoisomerase [Bacteroidales bacterium CF]|jgi:1-deoxy-D-xylulose 5-phosphate reductoisomerase|nr:1-deoxy-D-xylulose 5-phosphate reductoisomerase [Bacteroidales bacterium CF]
MKRRVAILGSTGSIGKQALEVISGHPEMFEVVTLTANTNAQLLIKQAKEFDPDSVVIASEAKYDEVFKALDPLGIKVFTGEDSISEIVRSSTIDIVLTAMVGFSGLKPTVEAIKAGKAIALANKETLVAAGEIITKLAATHHVPIIPVDSEHSAIFQCLQGHMGEIEKILLTSSGGPFFTKSAEEIANATVEQALNHPKWNMGAKITIDSASMMNKGLELIEAKWLFNVKPSDIEIIVHPQSIVHSMVQFKDGAVIAQLSHPDMRLPILYALSYPYRVDLDTKRLDFAEVRNLDFFKPDYDKFPCLRIATEAISKGGNLPCSMNAANEVAVYHYLKGGMPFSAIPKVIENVLSGTKFVAEPTLEEIFDTDMLAREQANIEKRKYN